MVVWTAIPVYWLVLSSISPQMDLYSVPPHWIPVRATLENFERILVKGGGFRGAGGTVAAELIRRGLTNSLIIAGGTTLIVLMIAPLVGYVFARLNFPGKNFFFFYIIAAIAVPSWPVLIGLFSIFNKLHLLDSLLGLIAVSLAYRIPFDVWFMKGYMSSIPRELEDQARIDGCTRLGSVFKILLPSCLPALVAVMIISFLFSWNMFLPPLVLSYTLKSKPITLTLMEFIGQFYEEWNLMAAGAVIAIMPPIMIALIFQKYIISGLTTGSIK